MKLLAEIILWPLAVVAALLAVFMATDALLFHTAAWRQDMMRRYWLRSDS